MKKVRTKLKPAPPIITSTNIFKQGVLCDITISHWGASAKMRKDQLATIPEEDRDVVKGIMDLLDDKQMIEALQKNGSKAKNYIKDYAVSYSKMWFIKTTFVEQVHNYLLETQVEREELVNDLIGKIDAMEKTYAKNHPNLYDPKKYPSKTALRAKYEMKWNWKIVETPDEDMKTLTPEMIKEERSKTREAIQEMKDATIALVGETLLKRISSLQKQCVDNKIHAKTINSLNSYIDRVENVFDDFMDNDKLKEMTTSLKSLINEREIGDFKDDRKFQKKVKKEIDQLAKEIEVIPEVKRKRAIRF